MDDAISVAGGFPLPDHLRRELPPMRPFRRTSPVAERLAILENLHPKVATMLGNVDLVRETGNILDRHLSEVEKALDILPIRSRILRIVRD